MTPSSSARAGLWIYSSQKRSSHLVSRSNAELCCMASLRYTRDALLLLPLSLPRLILCPPVASSSIFLILLHLAPFSDFLFSSTHLKYFSSKSSRSSSNLVGLHKSAELWTSSFSKAPRVVLQRFTAMPFSGKVGRLVVGPKGCHKQEIEFISGCQVRRAWSVDSASACSGRKNSGDLPAG